MTKLYTQQEIRELEQLAIAHGISGDEMMARAGSAAFNLLQECFHEAKSILVLCGGGNNGGDGYVVAQLAHEAGLTVYVRHLGKLNQLKGEASRAYKACKKAGVNIAAWNLEEELVIDVIVDALVGIGLSGGLKPEMTELVEVVNEIDIPVFAIDTPSGLMADTGAVAGAAIVADYTITFIGMKRGMLTGLGPDCCGALFCHDLDLPEDLFEQVSYSAVGIDAEVFKQSLGPRARGLHKGECGHVVVIGGAPGMNGAPRLSALGAARVGAGLVTIATHPEHAALLNQTQPEIMCHAAQTNDELKAVLDQASLVVIGPGLGQSSWSKRMLKVVLASKLPMVVDADALNLLSQQRAPKRDNWVLTPHPGEASRLLKIETSVIQADRFSAAQALRNKYHGTVVLKGAGSLIANEGGLLLCSDGNPGMASGGMGDLLSGVIAGLAAQGLELAFAAALGTCLHAAAADLAAQALGERGLLATDLLPYLMQLMNTL